jgi:hypothetical protein
VNALLFLQYTIHVAAGLKIVWNRIEDFKRAKQLHCSGHKNNWNYCQLLFLKISIRVSQMMLLYCWSTSPFFKWMLRWNYHYFLYHCACTFILSPETGEKLKLNCIPLYLSELFLGLFFGKQVYI